MSFAGNALTAKLTLSADASRVVGAAVEARVALKTVAEAARDVGKAGIQAGAGMQVATSASTVMTREQALVTKGLSLTGDARRAELLLLTEQAKKSGVVTAGVAAMSAAHNTYNSTVAQAKGLLDAGLIGQTKYKAAVDAAGVALALSAAETAGMGAATTEAAGNVRALEQLIGKLAGTAGVGGGQIKNLRGALKALPEVIANYPKASVFIGIAAAVGIAVAANDYYENSVRRMTIQAAAHGNVLGLQRSQYLALSVQMAQTASVSQVAGRAIVASLIDAGISPQAWHDSTAAAAGYARVIGEDVPKASAELNKAIVSQSAFEELNGQYNLVNDSQVQFMRNMDLSGDHMGAQGERARALRERFGEIKDEVGLVRGAFEGSMAALSNWFSSLGEGFEHTSPFILALPALAGGLGNFTQAVTSLQRLQQQAKDAASNQPDPEIAKRSQASIDVGNIMRRNNPFPTALKDNTAERTNVLKAYSMGAIDAATKTEALNGVDRKRQEILKAQRDAYLNLNETLKAHLERIKQLIQDGPQVIAQARMEADAAVALANVAGKSTLEQQKLNDAFAIQKAALPYNTALMWAHGSSAEKLRGIIKTLTEEMERNQKASHYTDTVNDIEGRIGSLGNTASLAGIDMILSENMKQLDYWKKTTLANLEEAKAGYQSFAQAEEIYNAQYQQILEDDLARRKDWAAGAELAMIDLTRSTQDWATTSSQLTLGAARTFEDSFVNAIIAQRNPLEAFFNWYLEQLVRIIYQQKLASSFNQVAGGLTDLVGSMFGTAAPGKIGVVSSYEGGGGMDYLAGLSSDVGFPAVQLHGGGSVRGANVTRGVDVSAIASLPRFHGGTKGGLNVGETLAVLRDDEFVDTPEQRAARNAVTTQPQVFVLGGGGGGAVPKIAFYVTNNGPPISMKEKGEARPNGNGGFNMDVMVDQIENKIADNIRRGNSPIGETLESTHNVRRTPG